MQSCYISYIDYHKPCYKLLVDEVLTKTDDSEKNKNYIKKYGNFDEIAIELRYNQFEMFDEMMEKYFAFNDPAEIRFLIFTGKEYFVNSGMSVPYYLIGKYGMKNASLIALNQGCTGTPQGIQLADCIIKADSKTKVMIASLSRISSIAERYDWPTINGDGAGMMVLGREGFLRVLDSYSWSDGAVSLERCANNGQKIQEDLMQREKLLMMNVKKMILKVLERNKICMKDIYQFIPQNVHHLLYRMYAKSINVKLDKFFLENIPKGGHIGDVDSVRNLKDVILKHNKNAGLKYLLFTLGDLGGNFSYYAVLLESC